MRKYLKKYSLLLWIICFVIIAIAALLGILWLIAWYQGSSIADFAENGVKQEERFYEALKASISIVGGIGGVAFLVIKYRERRDKERELERSDTAEADRKVKDAVELLGSGAPQVRLAGVYALADVADTYLGSYKQRVVDILCGYLRTDRSELLVDGKFKDTAVESAIIKVIGNHLLKDREDLEKPVQIFSDEQLWCDCKFEFRGVAFTQEIDWNRIVLHTPIDFSGAKFTREVNLLSAKFSDWVNFESASFGGNLLCGDAVFVSEALFAKCEFLGMVDFDNANFRSRGDFSEAIFAGMVIFQGAKFNGQSEFIDVIFARGASFDNVCFQELSIFVSLTSLIKVDITQCDWEKGIVKQLVLVPNISLTVEELTNPTRLQSGDEWTPEKKKARLEEVYLRFCVALKEHPMAWQKLDEIQTTIRKNFPDVEIDFEASKAKCARESNERAL